MKNFAINGYLEDIENFDIFLKAIVETMNIFIEIFGKDVMEKIDLYIDNSTEGSGYTPTTTPLFKKCIIIKLGIPNFSDEERIVYQYAHELCHYVFYSLKGFNKDKANCEEENICTAMSLIVINKLFPNSIIKWTSHVSNLQNKMYSGGAKIAKEIGFDILKLKERIYKICDA